MREAFRERIRSLNMGLENRMENAIGTLSGGQRQALTLLMASWLKPELLLLDEHTAALDPKSADQVIRLTREIVQRDKLTTLMVTHSMQQAVHLGDRIVMMHCGQVLHDLQGPERAACGQKISSIDLTKYAGANNSTRPWLKCYSVIMSDSYGVQFPQYQKKVRNSVLWRSFPNWRLGCFEYSLLWTCIRDCWTR